MSYCKFNSATLKSCRSTLKIRIDIIEMFLNHRYYYE